MTLCDNASRLAAKSARLTLVVEAVDSVDRGGFMVATKQEKVLLVLDLVAHEKADRLQPALRHARTEVFALQRYGRVPVRLDASGEAHP